MTSFAIIAETTQKVNLNASNNGAFPPLASRNTSSVVTVKCCKTFDSDPYATNQWAALRVPFQWHGDDVASFDDELYALIERNPTSKQAIFRHLDQPTTRVTMCADLLDSIIARTTYDLRSHNGEIEFVNGKVLTFRARTNDDGQRIIQEKRRRSWKLFGHLTPNGTVTPIIPSHLPEIAKDDDPRYQEIAADAQREIKIIEEKAKLINDPTQMMEKGVAVSFKGSCRCCNRKLTNPKSVAHGIGPTCAKKQSQAAVAMPTTSTFHYNGHELASSPVQESQATTDSAVSEHEWSHPQLQDLDLDSSLPLDAEEVLFCTSQLGAMGCSDTEIEQFFDDLLPSSPYWYPNFSSEATKHDKSFDFLYDVCDAFVYSITPVDDYVRIASQLFRYQRDALGYEFIACMGSRNGEIVELVAYPHEVQQVKQGLVWV